MSGGYIKEIDPAVVWVLAGLTILALLLAVSLYGIQNYTVRIYNWNGKRYCYLGRAEIGQSKDGFCVRIGERMADLSYTTLYQICPSRHFVRKNRYRSMMLCAGDVRCMLHVDGCMRQSVYYRKAWQLSGRQV